MAKREDGKETRRRLLNAACDVFAQNGYRNTKVADICKRAGANVASVNYYFGSKKKLYNEAWQYALQNFNESFFSESGTDSAEERLRAYIQTLVENFTAKGDLGRFSRLYLMEMVNPTGLIQDTWFETFEPKRRKLHGIIRDIMGPGTDDLSIRFCELSIVNQCREYMLGRPLDPELIKKLADHIVDFSLAGIQGAGCHNRS